MDPRNFPIACFFPNLLADRQTTGRLSTMTLTGITPETATQPWPFLYQNPA